MAAALQVTHAFSRATTLLLQSAVPQKRLRCQSLVRVVPGAGAAVRCRRGFGHVDADGHVAERSGGDLLISEP